jgi:DNA mismatch repair protein MutS
VNPKVPKSLGDTLGIINSSPDSIWDRISPISSRFGAKATVFGIIAGLTALQIWYSKTAFDSAKLKRDITNYLHAKTLAVAHYIRALRNINTIIEQHPILSQEPPFKPLADLLNTSDEKVKQLLDLLNSSTFRGKNATIISLSGRVLAAHKLIQEVKDALIPAIAALGHVDVYVSTAKLFADHSNERVTYCFPEYVNYKTPYICATQFWNPFISPTVAIPNDIEFGTPEHPNNAILTGPNTGGKTTTIKGVLLNILLAQTLGIAPARALTLTPFALLNCYLNVTDDLGTGTSLFKAEVLRAKALIEGIRGLPANKFSFTIIDELFSGTAPEEGQQASLQFAIKAGEHANSQLVIATHFADMPKLEYNLAELAKKFDTTYSKDPLCHYKNYRVMVYKKADGSLERPFKLEEGVSNINVAFDLLKEEGIL